MFKIKKREEKTRFYLKCDVLLLTCVFEKFIKARKNVNGINLLYSVSLPGYTWQCALKDTDIQLKILQDKDMNFLLESSIRGGMGSVKGDRYRKWDEKKDIAIWCHYLYGWEMSESLPYDKMKCGMVIPVFILTN